MSDSIFSKIIDCDTAKKASDKLKEEFEEEHKKGENILLVIIARRPIILRKIAGPKISDFFIVIIVIRIVR